MKISKDFKIGIIGLIVIIVFLMMVNFIKKSDLFDRDIKIQAVFNTASGIELKNLVLLKGLPIGIVDKMEPADRNMTGVKVTLKIKPDINIPSNSVAALSQGGPLSPNKIIIEKGNSKTVLDNGDIIKTKNDDMAGNLKAQVQPLAHKINNITDSLSTVLNQYNKKLDVKRQAQLRNRIASLTRQMEAYAALTQRLSQRTNGSLSSALKTTEDYTKRSDAINKMLQNANTKANNLAQTNLEHRVDSVNKQISTIRNKLASFTNSSGTLTKNRDAYNSLNEQLTAMEILFDDIRVNPKRYIDYSVTGKSSKAPEITKPEAAKQRSQRNVEFNSRQQEQYKN